MINNKLQKALLLGENIATEFKLCEGGISIETYKTVCSFLNRFGGDIYLGIDDNGTVKGIPLYTPVKKSQVSGKSDPLVR